jgi:hypothetical protein
MNPMPDQQARPVAQDTLEHAKAHHRVATLQRLRRAERRARRQQRIATSRAVAAQEAARHAGLLALRAEGLG